MRLPFATTVHEHCLALPDATMDHTFGPETSIYRIGNKIFALLAAETSPPWLSMKCEPGHALLLRDAFTEVSPGYHMSKRHWNTVILGGSVPEDEILSWIDDSYDLVRAGLPRGAVARTDR